MRVYLSSLRHLAFFWLQDWTMYCGHFNGLLCMYSNICTSISAHLALKDVSEHLGSTFACLRCL